MILMLSRTGFGIWAHMNLPRRHSEGGEKTVKESREYEARGKRGVWER